jgi:hypothetical protein
VVVGVLVSCVGRWGRHAVIGCRIERRVDLAEGLGPCRFSPLTTGDFAPWGKLSRVRWAGLVGWDVMYFLDAFLCTSGIGTGVCSKAVSL